MKLEEIKLGNISGSGGIRITAGDIHAYFPGMEDLRSDGGSDTNRRIETVLLLYRSGGNGKAIRFERSGGWFEGESELFSSSEILRGKRYEEKAYALMYTYYAGKGYGSAFLKNTAAYRSALKISEKSVEDTAKELYKGTAKKEEVEEKLTKVLREHFMESFREEVNGKSVFGSSKGEAAGQMLYGNRRKYIY